MTLDIQIFDAPLDLAYCVRTVSDAGSGGIQVFIGNVRNQTAGKTVLRLEYEAYHSMALREMEKIANEAGRRWDITGVVVHHRTGILSAGETAVIVAVGAAHRHAAIDACRYIIDTLKATVPIWKKEVFEDGAVWVSAFP
ncbi:MAG: molybdenum cofactor biosynthesis protein MoaE [Bacteroidota bacterium]|jgi:molybdopterin synthase catalytic subunit